MERIKRKVLNPHPQIIHESVINRFSPRPLPGNHEATSLRRVAPNSLKGFEKWSTDELVCVAVHSKGYGSMLVWMECLPGGVSLE